MAANISTHPASPQINQIDEEIAEKILGFDVRDNGDSVLSVGDVLKNGGTAREVTSESLTPEGLRDLYDHFSKFAGRSFITASIDVLSGRQFISTYHHSVTNSPDANWTVFEVRSGEEFRVVDRVGTYPSHSTEVEIKSIEEQIDTMRRVDLEAAEQGGVITALEAETGSALPLDPEATKMCDDLLTEEDQNLCYKTLINTTREMREKRIANHERREELRKEIVQLRDDYAKAKQALRVSVSEGNVQAGEIIALQQTANSLSEKIREFQSLD